MSHDLMKESPTYVLTRLDKWNHDRKVKFYSKEFCEYLESEKEKLLEEITDNYYDKETTLLILDNYSADIEISHDRSLENKKPFSKGFYSVINILNNNIEIGDGWLLKDLFGEDVYKTKFEPIKKKIRKISEFISKIEDIVKDDPCIILNDEDIDKIFLESFGSVGEYVKITNYTLDFIVVFYSAMPKTKNELLIPLKKSIDISKHLNSLINKRVFADLAK